MRIGRATNLFWATLAAAHVYFLIRLILGMSGAEFEGSLGSELARAIGLVGCIAFCGLEALGKGMLGALAQWGRGRGSTSRTLIAFWLCVALLHAGVPTRELVGQAQDNTPGQVLLAGALMGVVPLMAMALQPRRRRSMRRSCIAALRGLAAPLLASAVWIDRLGAGDWAVPPRRDRLHHLRFAQLPPPAASLC